MAQARTVERQAVLRFCLVVIGWLACLLTWVSVLSFDVADPPSTTVWTDRTTLHNLCGPVGAWLAFQLFHYIGLAVYPTLFLVNAAILAWSRGARLNDLWLRFFGLGVVTTVCASGATLAIPHTERYLISGPGGVLGTTVAALLRERLDLVGTVLLLCLGLVVGLLLAADNLLLALFRGARWAGERSGPAIMKGGSAMASAGAAVATGMTNLSGRLVHAGGNGNTLTAPRPAAAAGLKLGPGSEPNAPREPAPPQTLREPTPAQALREPGLTRTPSELAPVQALRAPAAEPPDVEADEPESPSHPAATPAVRDVASGRPVRREAPRPPVPRPADESYDLPPLSLLERAIPVDRASIEAVCREKAVVLEQTLNEFRLEVQVVSIQTGPVITVFELQLAPGIKGGQIASLSNDIARALKAPAVRVAFPLPGRSTVGIEVPNTDKEKVRLREVLELAGSRSEQLAVPLFLGKDVAGQPLVADLTRMPHLLIAGTTGSGKSVCVTSLIMSVLMTRSPSEVQMILVDPKVVELAMYRDVPHLMCPIVTETARAEGILDWASTKMDERYALLAEAGVKDIRSYNRLGLDGLRERLQPASEEELAQIPVRLPYIVIMIDELADLMMTSPKEVEFFLCRIAQKSRAVGIHLIVSTQRPQASVVTGLIKSNLPCRISFRVSSRLDSRIVLDQNGGETLMGQGDMLFLPPGSSKLLRAQGTFVDDDELKAVVKHCRQQREQIFHPELVRLPSGEGPSAEERDELFDQAVEAILETKRGSVSLLQRRFGIGYGRASRLVDQMYAAGIVGEYKGSQAREVLLTKEEWEALRTQRDREEAAEGEEAEGSQE